MLDREGIAAIGEETIRQYIANPEALGDAVMRVTSGTSGKPPVMMLMRADAFINPTYESWYWGAERVVICHGLLVYRQFNCLAEARSPKNARVLPLDNNDLNESLTPLLADFAPEQLVAFPSFMLRIGEWFDRATAAGVRSLKCSGELMTDDLKAALLNLFPNAVIAAGYVTSEFGPISKETCGCRPLNHFHPREGITVEVIEPDEAGVGDVVVSTTIIGDVPVRQYVIGDVGRILSDECPCGEKITFEVLGRRGYDYIKLGGALLVQSEFDRVARRFPQIIDDYRATASTITESGRLVGHIALTAYSRQGIPSSALQCEVTERFSNLLYLTADKTLADLVSLKEFAPLTIEWVRKPFPPMHKSVKIRRV